MVTTTRTRPLYETYEEETAKRPAKSPMMLAAITAAAAAAGITYLLTGERGEQAREKFRDWSERFRELDRDRFVRIVDTLLGKYERRDRMDIE